MATYRKNSKWKSILCGILVVATLIGVCAGLAVFSKKDTVTIKASAFTRGDLDENGQYIESEQAIYTKDAFDCIGLRVEPDFEFQGTFDVYYYNYTGDLVEVKNDLNCIFAEEHPLAKMARIVIHPEIPEEMDEEDFEIKFWEVGKYSRKLTITVDKNQKYLYDGLENLYDEDSVTENMSIANPVGGVKDTVNLFEHTGAKATHQIMVEEGVTEYHIFVRCTYPPTSYINVAISNIEGQALEDTYLEYYQWFGNNHDRYEWVKLEIEVPDKDTVDHLRVSMPSNAECYIYAIK